MCVYNYKVIYGSYFARHNVVPPIKIDDFAFMRSFGISIFHLRLPVDQVNRGKIRHLFKHPIK